MNTATLTIGGMHCDGCAERIKRLLEKEPGVREADVSFATGVSRVRYNPHAVSEDRLVELIVTGGFSVPARSA